MNNIFDQLSREKILTRLHMLQPGDQASWGKMNVYQMLRHCSMSEEIFLETRKYKRLFIGRLFGPIALGSILNNDSPMKKNLPTHPELKIRGSGDFESEHVRWSRLVNQYADFTGDEFIHPFFGKMSREKIGRFIYKHSDHHLRQFGR